MIKYISTCTKKTNIKFCDYLIVDEVHLGTIDIELVIRYWETIKKSFPNIKLPSLIKMSATYESDGVLYEYKKEKVSFATTIDYYNQIFDYLPQNLKTNNRKPYDVVSFMPDLIMIYVELSLEQRSTGTALVFLPGIHDIKTVERKLINLLDNTRIRNQYDIFIAHSSSKPEDLQILNDPKPDRIKWRFVLSTNIAETSITIPDVSYVFDSLLEIYRHLLNLIFLNLIPTLPSGMIS